MKKYFLLLLLLLAVRGFSQITITPDGNASSCSSTSTVSTASVTTTSSQIRVLFVFNYNSGGASVPSSVSGGGVTTWSQVATIQFATSNTRRVTVYRGVGNGSSGVVTVTWSTNQPQKYLDSYLVGGAPVTNNGADAISATTGSGTSQINPSITMPSISNPNNGVLVFFGGISDPGATSAEVGFTNPYASPAYTASCFAQERWVYPIYDNATTDNTPTMNTTNAVTWGGIALQLAGPSNRRIFIN